jgi:chemotaxis protein MotB
MMRKRRHGKVNHDRWLISYADFVTLLFAFFVVLFATGQADKRKKVELAESIQSAFNQMGFFEVRTGKTASAGLLGSGPPAIPLAGGGDSGPVPGSIATVQRAIEEAARPEIAAGWIGLHESPEGLVISLQEAGFFDSGAAEIRSSALPVLDRIADVLPQTAVRVEGHTDNVPIHTGQFASNWELSSARASSIARLLLVHDNVHAELLSVAGYAEFHPAADNGTSEGRARNRRVDLVLLTKPKE